ncbi:hypothetical protein M9H77_17962 [Catharanthus roseus]|uniref:Uncharacterized protein n=1 Tax=Catharanthus roseus TaxID=4058 RepID=A0ACC0B650_CATRO|nr:hypothetical protein M9H77_17962 [Catharanthus roseus]
MEEEEIEEKQENDQEAQSPPQVVIYPKGHTKDEIIGDVSQGVRTRRGRTQSGGKVITSRVNGKNIVFDDILLNSILETPDDGMCFYTKNKKCYDPNLYSEKRFEEIFTKGIVLKKSEDRIVDKLDAYGRILYHIISNIVIPNVGHKSSITNMRSFVMLAMHEHRKMNFGYIAIEHMLVTLQQNVCPMVVFLPSYANLLRSLSLDQMTTLESVRYTIKTPSRGWDSQEMKMEV